MKDSLISEKKKFYLLTFNQDWGDEHDVPALACFTQKQFDEWCKSKHEVHARLGNGGEGFMEDKQWRTGKYYVKEGFVTVRKVDESFHKTFKKARLADLSLCCIFDIH